MMPIMQIPKPTKARALVFTVPMKRKIPGSLLFSPAPRRNSYSGAQECWIIDTGPEFSEAVKRGSKCYVHDGFEFEEIKYDELWDALKGLPEFSALKAYVDDVDGQVTVQLVTESALLAVED